MTKIVFGIFHNKNDAEDAISDLHEAGYNPQDISVLMKDHTAGKKLTTETNTHFAGDVASGITTGAVIGGIAGLLAGIAIPGIGGLLVGGPIVSVLGITGSAAAAVSGATTGIIAGGLVGVLTGLGLSSDEAKIYETDIEKGAIFLAIPADIGGVSEVIDILDDNNADKVRFSASKKYQKKSDDTYVDEITNAAEDLRNIQIR